MVETVFRILTPGKAEAIVEDPTFPPTPGNATLSLFLARADVLGSETWDYVPGLLDGRTVDMFAAKPAGGERLPINREATELARSYQRLRDPDVKTSKLVTVNGAVAVVLNRRVWS